MAEHLKALDLDPRDVMVIGDSGDDGIAARHVGARAVRATGRHDEPCRARIARFPRGRLTSRRDGSDLT